MKKQALAAAILAAGTLPALAAAAGPTLYGKINLSLGSIETKTAGGAVTDAWYVTNHASRIGIKGDAETGVAGLTGVYYAEFGVKADDGAGPFSARNIYTGLKGDFGTIRVGNIDTPLKDSQGKVDQFNDLAGDIQNLLAGENRAANIIYYTSPKLADAITINVSTSPAEGVNIDSVAGVEDGIFDNVGASVVYEKGAIYAALAVERTGVAAGTADSFGGRGDIVRLTTTYKADAWELGFLYSTAEDLAAGGKEDAALLLSGAYKNDKWKLKAQYGINEGDVTGNERTLTALGADYALGKTTALYGYWSKVHTEQAGPNPQTTTLAFGIDQRF